MESGAGFDYLAFVEDQDRFDEFMLLWNTVEILAQRNGQAHWPVSIAPPVLAWFGIVPRLVVVGSPSPRNTKH